MKLDPNVVAFRNNTGGWGRLRYGLGKGGADIIVCVGPTGRFLALEAKARGEVMSDDQLKWAAEVERRNGVYRLVYEVQDAWKAVAEVRNAA